MNSAQCEAIARFQRSLSEPFDGFSVNFRRNVARIILTRGSNAPSQYFSSGQVLLEQRYLVLFCVDAEQQAFNIPLLTSRQKDVQLLYYIQPKGLVFLEFPILF